MLPTAASASDAADYPEKHSQQPTAARVLDSGTPASADVPAEANVPGPLGAAHPNERFFTDSPKTRPPHYAP